MFDIQIQILLRTYCPRHARVKRMTKQTDGRIKQPSQVACVSEGLKY